MLLTPVSSPVAKREPRRGFGILRMDVLRELPELDGSDRQRARDFEAAVHGREMVRVVGIFDESLEAQQHGEALAVEREARRCERGGTQGIAVDPPIRLLHPLCLSAQRRRQREQVMRERRGLRLHAVRIGGNDRFGVPARHREQLVAGGHQRFNFLEQTVAQVHARDGRRDVLAASAGVQARCVRAGGRDEPRLVVEIVG